MTTNFYRTHKLFVNLVFGFIVSTIIGTLSHETGHLLVGRWLGYTGSQLHYGSAGIGHSAISDSLGFYYKAFRHQLKNNSDFPQREHVSRLIAAFDSDLVCIRWGGPLQTMLTGTIGFIALNVMKRGRKNARLLSLADWIWVFVALFWLRQLANFTVMLGLWAVSGRYGHGDETFLSAQYGLPIWSINILTAGASSIVLYYVIFQFIPQQQRLTFITSGLVGGVTGYALWLELAGPIVLP